MASGDTLVFFTPHCMEPAPSSNYAQIATRNKHLVLTFDATNPDAVLFRGVMPRQYAAGGVTVYIHYSMATATTGDVDWDAAFERIGDQQQDLDADGFAAANSVNNTTVPGTAGLVDIVNITFTDGADMDSVAVGESFRIKISRDGASDTATGNAEVTAVEIKET